MDDELVDDGGELVVAGGELVVAGCVESIVERISSFMGWIIMSRRALFHEKMLAGRHCTMQLNWRNDSPDTSSVQSKSFVAVVVYIYSNICVFIKSVHNNLSTLLSTQKSTHQLIC